MMFHLPVVHKFEVIFFKLGASSLSLFRIEINVGFQPWFLFELEDLLDLLNLSTNGKVQL